MKEKIPQNETNEIPFINIEKEISKEEIKKLPDETEPGTYYRGMNAEDAIKSIFGKLNLDANPKYSNLGERDNATVNLHESVYFSPTSKTNKNKEFLCSVGFDPFPNTKIEGSYLGRNTHARITGPIIGKEIFIRFAGKKPGQPSKLVKHFSPKEFYEWYQKNMNQKNPIE